MFQHPHQEQNNSGQYSHSGERVLSGPSPLFRQYLNVFTKPSVATFAEQMGQARWGSVWRQLLGFACFSGLMFALLGYLNARTTLIHTAEGGKLLALFACVVFLLVVALFFLHTGVFYLCAKMPGGKGTFLAHSYITLQFLVPSAVLVEVLTLLIGLISLSAWQFLAWPVWFIYSTVLDILVIKSVHRLSGGTSTWVVVLPLVVIVWGIASMAQSVICCSPPPH
jgi:hypothetical protein